MAPESSRPILRITSLLGPAAWGASWAMVYSFAFNTFAAPDASCARPEGGIKPDYSFVYEQNYTNGFCGAIGPRRLSLKSRQVNMFIEMRPHIRCVRCPWR